MGTAEGEGSTEYTRLGRSDLKVSRLALGGAWAYGKTWTDFDEDAAEAAVRRGLELGVTFFDTARAYGFGKSERVIGNALKDAVVTDRDDLVIATKGGLDWRDGGFVRDTSRDGLRRDLAASLDALGVDHVDVYMVHWPDPSTPVAETAAAMREFVDEGTVRAVGASNFTVEDLREFEQHCPVEVLQPAYHLFERAIETDILPWCAEHNTGVFVWGPLAHGLLGGRYGPDQTFPDGDWRSVSPMFEGETFRRNLAVVDRLKEVAARDERTVAELAVAWTLAHPAVHATILGARRPAHVETLTGAADYHLDRDTLAEIDTIVRDAEWVSPKPESV